MIKNMRESIVELIFNIKVFRLMICIVFLIRGTFYYLVGNIYKAAVDCCWLYRVPDIKVFKRISFHLIQDIIRSCQSKRENIILKSFLINKDSIRAKEKYTLNGDGDLNLYRDVIILKKYKTNEKGVLLIKYTPTFDALLAFFKINDILQKYYVVLEPSWAGYCDPSILMFITENNPVVVQCPEESDYNFIEKIKTNLIPVKLGASDWVDDEIFTCNGGSKKKYDLIMVAHWGRFKNHRELFKALSQIKSKFIRLVLVGFNWGGRTKKDIIREMNSFDLRNIEVDMLENLPSNTISKVLNQSKVFVLLSKKEGTNKAIVEAFFANVPAILYEKFIGGAKEKINSQTGILSSFEDLSKNIEYMLNNYQKYSPRAWAVQNTGSKISSKKLNDLIKGIAEIKGEKWTIDIFEKVNSPNLSYKGGAKNIETSEFKIENIMSEFNHEK